MARGALEPAEQHARQALQADENDAESLAILGGILEVENRTAKPPMHLDARSAWIAFELAGEAGRPQGPCQSRGAAGGVSRHCLGGDGDVCSGRCHRHRPGTPVARGACKAAIVVTDVRTHSPWIWPVTQAGLMDVFPNHTFSPIRSCGAVIWRRSGRRLHAIRVWRPGRGENGAPSGRGWMTFPPVTSRIGRLLGRWPPVS